MDSKYEHFLHDMLDICSKFFKELHGTCEKYKTGGTYVADQDGGSSVKKPKKKIHDPLKEDPNAPKKPIIQGYLLYYTEVRPQKQKENPSLPNPDLTKLIAEDWNKLPKNLKEPYEIKARVNKTQYEKDLEEYLSKNPKMREAVNNAKNANKKPSAAEESSVNESAVKKQPQKKKILAISSSDDDDDDNIKIKEVDNKASFSHSKRPPTPSSSSDSDEDSDDDDSEDDQPIKKNKK